MTDLSPVAMPTQPPAPVVTGMVAQASARFGQTLGAFLDAQGAAADLSAVPLAVPAASDRQAAADDGKDLPAPPTDPDADAETPLLSWSTLLAPLPVPLPAFASDVPSTVVQGPNPPVAVAVALPLPPDPAGADPAAHTAPAEPTTAPAVIVPATVTAADIPATSKMPPAATFVVDTTIKAAVPVDPKAFSKPSDGPVTISDDSAVVTPLVAQRAAPAIAVSPIPQPARQVFAAAIAAASGWRDKAAKAEPFDGVIATPSVALTPVDRAIVTATGQAHDTPLDLGRESGLQGVIDRIETLRDDADARDTRIRLVPDALGGVDIAVRMDGDTLRVHFTAERAATQALLVDAQPRLTDIAAARGLRIDASVSTGGNGTQGNSAQGQGGNAAPQPRSPAPNRPIASESPDHPEDTRLA